MSAAAVAALKAQQEEVDRKKREEEELRKQLEEEERLAQIEEERLALEEAERRKRQKEQAKKNQAERKKQQKIREARQRILSMGLSLPEHLKTEEEKAAERAERQKAQEERQRIKKEAEEKAKRDAEKAEEAKKEKESGKNDGDNKEASSSEDDDWEAAASSSSGEDDDWEADATSEDDEASSSSTGKSSAASSVEPEAAAATATDTTAATTATEVQGAEGDLRSPICCVLGHVDTGKTKLLDRIRRTNVQDKEAGGITQQIGATYFPHSVLKAATKAIADRRKVEVKIPGLLVIDTPGHSSFTNLRSRGTNLCDIAILVVDLMHGVEQQTIESIKLLKARRTPFVIALNKCDQLYEWKKQENKPIRASLKQQNKGTMQQFHDRLNHARAQLAAHSLNVDLYWENTNPKQIISMVPTSAHTGEGIPDLLLLLAQMTQTVMKRQITYGEELDCTVLEVKKTPGHGSTIDVILINGELRRKDRIVVCGTQGAIVTQIRSLLVPPANRELRVKTEYDQPEMVRAAQGIKIAATGLEYAVPGSALYVLHDSDDEEEVKRAAQEELAAFLERTKTEEEGVYVQASTLGSLEALLEFLRDSEIPVARGGISVGTVHKRDIMKASSMLERNRKYAVLLAFDVDVHPDARQMADDIDLRIFEADIIYHLFDMFTDYVTEVRRREKEEAAEHAVFPCQLEILANGIFRTKNPLVLGCRVKAGSLHNNTPLCIPAKKKPLGKVIAIQQNHQDVDVAKTGDEVAVRIDSPLIYGRHFDLNDAIYSQISRKSIDTLKENFRDQITKEDVRLLVKLKRMLEIH